LCNEKINKNPKGEYKGDYGSLPPSVVLSRLAGQVGLLTGIGGSAFLHRFHSCLPAGRPPEYSFFTIRFPCRDISLSYKESFLILNHHIIRKIRPSLREENLFRFIGRGRG